VLLCFDLEALSGLREQLYFPKRKPQTVVEKDTAFLFLFPLKTFFVSFYLPSERSIAIEMASLEDYDEFGNYIGADLESDEDEENMLPEEFQQRPQVQERPLEGFGGEREAGADDMALMEVDGEWLVSTDAKNVNAFARSRTGS